MCYAASLSKNANGYPLRPLSFEICQEIVIFSIRNFTAYPREYCF